MINRLGIYLLLAACLVLGGVVYAELQPMADDQAGVSDGPAPREAAPVMHRQPGTRVDELLATALARPLFSSTRRPPQTAANDAATADLGDTRLTGIVTAPGRRVAIFAVNGAKPLTLTEGEAVSGWHIDNITPREVALSGPGGTKTLEPKTDPSLAPPAPPNPQAAVPNAAGRFPVPSPAAASALPRPPGIPGPPLRPGRPGVRQ
jgi:hypothetical protein